MFNAFKNVCWACCTHFLKVFLLSLLFLFFWDDVFKIENDKDKIKDKNWTLRICDLEIIKKNDKAKFKTALIHVAVIFAIVAIVVNFENDNDWLLRILIHWTIALIKSLFSFMLFVWKFQHENLKQHLNYLHYWLTLFSLNVIVFSLRRFCYTRCWWVQSDFLQSHIHLCHAALDILILIKRNAMFLSLVQFSSICDTELLNLTVNFHWHDVVINLAAEIKNCWLKFKYNVLICILFHFFKFSYNKTARVLTRERLTEVKIQEKINVDVQLKLQRLQQFSEAMTVFLTSAVNLSSSR